MRLTRKNKAGNYVFAFGVKQDTKLLFNELGQLEDIEEKHNIKSFDELDNKLKALEIIKDYPFVVFHIIKGTTYYELQHEMPNTELPTEEEYDLLKEVLL